MLDMDHTVITITASSYSICTIIRTGVYIFQKNISPPFIFLQNLIFFPSKMKISLFPVFPSFLPYLFFFFLIQIYHHIFPKPSKTFSLGGGVTEKYTLLYQREDPIALYTHNHKFFSKKIFIYIQDKIR